MHQDMDVDVGVEMTGDAAESLVKAALARSLGGHAADAQSLSLL